MPSKHSKYTLSALKQLYCTSRVGTVTLTPTIFTWTLEPPDPSPNLRSLLHHFFPQWSSDPAALQLSLHHILGNNIKNNIVVLSD